MTDVFTAYLILTDFASITGHLIYLGVPVPPLLVTLVTSGKAHLEKTVEHALDRHGHDDFPPCQPRAPRPPRPPREDILDSERPDRDPCRGDE